MRVVLAVTTFNRLPYLKTTLKSWRSTRSKSHEWTLLIADDGSTDGTKDFLKKWLYSFPHRIIHNKRRGIHHQVNSILRACSDLDYDFAFKIDDDLLFKQRGWDDAYIEAATASGFDHLVFHDPGWKRVKRQREATYDETGLLECKSYWNDLQGALWTFTPRVVKMVGYFDLHHFGPCGFGHRDYTYRCCKAGFNVFENIFDIRDSLQYLELIKENYRSAPDRDQTWKQWNTPALWKYKLSLFNDERLYIPYNELPIDIYGKSLIKM